MTHSLKNTTPGYRGYLANQAVHLTTECLPSCRLWKHSLKFSSTGDRCSTKNHTNTYEILQTEADVKKKEQRMSWEIIMRAPIQDQGDGWDRSGKAPLE